MADGAMREWGHDYKKIRMELILLIRSDLDLKLKQLIRGILICRELADRMEKLLEKSDFREKLLTERWIEERENGRRRFLLESKERMEEET